MPIDPSIALGVRPVEMPNVLGQFGQMVAIKAAQQEMEGNEGSRNALAKGMEPTDPRILQYGKSGRETFKAAGEGRIKQLEAASKSNLLLGSIFGGVLQDPTTGPQAVARLKDMGLLTEAQAQKVIAEAGNNPDVWRRIAKPYYDGAISAEKRLADETSRENARTTSGPGYLQAGISRERLNMERSEQENIARILRGEPPVPTGGAPVAPMTGGGGGVAPMTGGGRAPVTAPMSGVAPVNALVPNAAPVAGGASMPVAPVVQPNVNALNATPAVPATANVNALTENAVPPQIAQMQTQISQLIRAGSPKAIAAADALIKQHNMLMPSQQIVQNQKGEYIRVDQRSGVSTPVIDASGQPLVGKLPPPVFESEYAKLVGRSAAERDVALVTSANTARENLPKLYETLDQIKTSDAITGFGANIIKNIEAARAKFSNDIKAGKKVADTEILDAMLGSDVFPMIQSLGIGAKGLDTPAEREYLRGVMTGTITMNKDALIKLTEIRKNIAERAIDLYNDAGTRGKLDKYFETQGAKFDFMYPPAYTPKTTTPQAGGSVRVTLPDGRSVILPDAEAAAKFKKDAGIK